MNDYWTVGIDGIYRRYEVLVHGEWLRVGNSLPIERYFAKYMTGYRVIQLGGRYEETVVKTFIDP